MTKFFDQLSQRFAHRIRDGVVKDISNGRQIGASRLGLLVGIAAYIVLLMPYLVAAFGAATIFFNRDSISLMGIGGLFIAAGFYLLPRRIKNTQTTLRRSDAPTLFSLLDEISAHLKAPEISGVHTTASFNAYMASYGNSEHIVGVGATLWKAMDGHEKLAVLSHEIAHLINNDPARSKLCGKALETLERWYDLTHPPMIIDRANNTSYYYEDRGLIGQVVSFLFGSFISLVSMSFEKLIFAESQRAEYLADVAATKVAGIEASNNALKILILAPIAEETLRHLHFDGSQDIEVFDAIAAAVRHPDKTRAEQLYATAIQDKLSVDSTHPPTRFRMEVIAAAGSDKAEISANTVDWATIDQELSQGFHLQEQKLLDKMISQ